MSPLVEPEVEMAKVVREAYERVVANVIKDQGQDWAARVPGVSQRPGAPASEASRMSGLSNNPAKPGLRQRRQQ